MKRTKIWVQFLTWKLVDCVNINVTNSTNGTYNIYNTEFNQNINVHAVYVHTLW